VLALTISIICLTLFSLVYKMTARKGYDALTVATVQYMTALVLVGVAAAVVVKPGALNVRAVGLGICGGGSMFLAIGMFFYVVRHGYLSVSWAIINLSVMIPVLASVIFWGEVPNLWQLAGLVFVAAALLSFVQVKGLSEVTAHPKGLVYLIISFICSGIGVTTGKALHEWQLDGYLMTYLLSLYVTAGTLAVVYQAYRRVVPRRGAVLYGTFMGTMNACGFAALVIALTQLPGLIAFPVRSSVNLILTTIISVILWGEELGRRGWLGLAYGVLAVWLLHVTNGPG
jgi:drug/metabolite transporter (DMT)-like permease